MSYDADAGSALIFFEGYEDSSDDLLGLGWEGGQRATEGDRITSKCRVRRSSLESEVSQRK